MFYANCRSSLLTVTLCLRHTSTNKAEELHTLATTGLNYLGNLGHLTSMLSLDKLPELMRDQSDHHNEILLDDIRSALFTLGELQSGIAEAVYDNVTELYELLQPAKS